MEEKKDTTDLMNDRKTPVHESVVSERRSLRHRTREMFRFMAPPRIRKVGWYVLVVIVVVLGMIELNRWTEGSVYNWFAWMKMKLWDSNQFVAFIVGGFLFRYLWPLRERDIRDE